MSCTSPQCYLVPLKGGRPCKSMEDYPVGIYPGLGRVVYLPCGGCLSCRRERRQELTLLQCCEASLYDDNWFITLTYDDYKTIQIDGLPPFSLNKQHIQSFLESLRKGLQYLGVKPRYFGCGEYGELYNRPHYHLSLFGCPPSALGLEDDVMDLNSRKDSLSRFGSLRTFNHASLDSNGNAYWYSPFIGSRWEFGSHKIYRANRETFQYVAGYVTKKLTGQMAKDRFSKDQKIPEFSFQSRPSIGFPWFDKYRNSLVGLQLIGEVVQLAGTSWKCPRIFDKWLRLVDHFDGARIADKIKLLRTAKVDPLPDRVDLARKRNYEIYREKQFSILNKNQQKGLKNEP